MGTRNLFKIIKDNKTVLAKYNQWDGYLDGQGKGLSEFIVNDLNFETLNNGLTRVKMLKENSQELNDIYETIGVEKYPLLTRDTTVNDQLKAISIGVMPLETFDASEFQKDGLFCEYVYEMNLDTNSISVFVTNKLKNGDYGACDKTLFTCDILEYPETLDKYIELNKGE
jgi:hypothetical protein